MSSPYKKFRQAAKDYVGFRRLSQFEQDIAYQLYDLVLTQHEKYGDGYCAFVKDNKGKKWRVQLPCKYLRRLDLPQDIEIFKTDISQDKAPYLVYRGQLEDGSYEMEFCERSPQLDTCFRMNSPVPVIEDPEPNPNEDAA